MSPPSASHILLCSGPATSDLHTILAEAGFRTTLHTNGHEPPGLEDFNLAVVDASARKNAGLDLCHRLRHSQGDNFVPILYVTGDSSPNSRLASLESGADTYILRPFETAELLAQIQGFLRIKERHDHLSARSAEITRINTKLQQAYQQIDQELVIARRIQESFLPRELPKLPQVRLAVEYRTCGRVGGDFYDVFRLDEQHLGFYVADAVGHGVPASLLTIFVKTGVKGKEIHDKSYRLVPPGEVLKRLNNDLIGQELSDQPFVTMVYVLFNYREGTLKFSRAGHPYPLYIPKDGPTRFWQMEGSLLGVFDIQFGVQEHQLRPGDKVVLYTDGMDAGGFAQHPIGAPSLLAAAEHFRDLPIDALVQRLSHDLFGQTQQQDDLTVLGLEYLPKPE